MRDIVVVGSLNVDLSVEAERLPSPGETVRAGDLVIGAGGKGLNQAIACARLGGRVHMVGRVGRDRFCDLPVAALRDAGVDATYVAEVEGSATGTALILVARDGQNAIAVTAGANAALAPAHVSDAVAAFRASGVLLVQLEVHVETVDAALALAREQRLASVLDPAPALELPDALLRKVDVLTPNETEAERLCGVRVGDVESAAAAGSRLRERTQGDVVVTLGAAGCVWVSSTGFEHVPSPRVRALDATGAGDAFNGGLAVALARGEPMARALRHAVLAGAASTRRRGAAASMPTPEDVEALG